MKKLFVFCLLASFTLAANSFAGDVPGDAIGFARCNSSYTLQSCPAHAICYTCWYERERIENPSIPGSYMSTGGYKYKIKSCETGYKKVGNKCMPKILPGSIKDKVNPKLK